MIVLRTYSTSLYGGIWSGQMRSLQLCVCLVRLVPSTVVWGFLGSTLSFSQPTNHALTQLVTLYICRRHVVTYYFTHCLLPLSMWAYVCARFLDVQNYKTSKNRKMLVREYVGESKYVLVKFEEVVNGNKCLLIQTWIFEILKCSIILMFNDVNGPVTFKKLY